MFPHHAPASRFSSDRINIAKINTEIVREKRHRLYDLEPLRQVVCDLHQAAEVFFLISGAIILRRNQAERGKACAVLLVYRHSKAMGETVDDAIEGEVPRRAGFPHLLNEYFRLEPRSIWQLEIFRWNEVPYFLI